MFFSRITFKNEDSYIKIPFNPKPYKEIFINLRIGFWVLQPRGSNRPTPGAAVVHAARQHTPTQSSRAPSRAAPGALSAAMELLGHPPSSKASPGAMKQWRDDVDSLLSMAHSGSARPRPRSFRRQREASVSVRSPSVKAAPTEDLWAELNRRRAGEDAPISLERPNDLRTELNRRRAGEDARVSLERARERRLNFEGRNLDQDFPPPAPQTPRGARTHMGVPLVSVGCAALVDHLHVVTWPSKFWPHRYVKPVGIFAGLCHHHYGSWWRHCCDGELFPCSLDRADLDLAHEPDPGIHLLLGRALCTVHSELCQCLSATWCGGSSPCHKARTRGDPPGLHHSLH
jgi:hypothetical protein